MILLTPTQYQIYMHLTTLGPVGQPVRFTTKTAMEDLKINRQTSREALVRLSEQKLIKRVGQYTITPLVDPNEVKLVSNPSIRPTRGAIRLLETLVRFHAMGIGFRMDTWEVMRQMKMHNKTNFIRLFPILRDIGALEYEALDSDNLFLNVRLLKRPEEYERVETLNAQIAKNETIRLANEVGRLQQILLNVQAQTPTAWLWKKKGAVKWSNVTLEAPTREDLKTLDFKPLYANDVSFHEEINPTYVHVKTGGEYRLLASFKWEEDCDDSYLYKSMHDGSNWGRRQSVFNDGRFINKEPTE